MTVEEATEPNNRDDAGLAADEAPTDNTRADTQTTARRGSGRSRWARVRRRKPIKRAVILAHRWTSLVLGLALVLITTTGALVVYTPEWLAWSNSSVFTTTSTANPISMSRAVDLVNQAHPGFQAGTVNVYKGLYEVMSSDSDAHPGFWGSTRAPDASPDSLIPNAASWR